MNVFTPEQLQDVVSVLRSGGVVVFPTETSYGLGCDATNTEAVAKIFDIKGRPEGRGTPVLIPNAESAQTYIEFGARAQKLAMQHWPGALNIVGEITSDSPIASQCSEGGFQAVRVSSHPLAQELVKQFGGPVVATSANVTGEGPLFDASLVEGMFADRPVKPDALLDGGELTKTPASTTVRVEGETVEVLRQGEIAI